MRITIKRLKAVKACTNQVKLFETLYPTGVEPTVENMTHAAAAGLEVDWSFHLLPAEGPGSQRAYALWCAEQVAHLNTDPRVEQCLEVVRRKVADPASVTDVDLAAAGDAARAAARAAGDAAWAALAAALAAAGDAAWATRDAAWAARAAAGDVAWAAGDAVWATRAAAREAQIAYLSQLLLET